MKSIYKYVLTTEKLTITDRISKILSAINQNDNIVVYAEIDFTFPIRRAVFKAIGTGVKIEDDELLGFDFLNTVPLHKESIIRHIYYMILPLEKGV